MARIHGGLIVDMFPDGTVRLVFLPDKDAGYESPIKVDGLDAAEVLFMACGLTPERAAALRDEVQRNKVASVDTSIDEAIVAKFRNTRPD